MKAYIYFNIKGYLDYDGEGPYVLVTEDNKCIGSHICSSRTWANYDLTLRRLEELIENNISEVYSNGKLVWQKPDIIEELSKKMEE